MSLFARVPAVVALTPAADYTNYQGYTVTIASDTATLSGSATTPVAGVILNGNPTTKKVSVGLLGSLEGTVLMKCSGSIAQGARVQQAADGTIVTDAGTGSRVVIGLALEAGVSGDLIEVATYTPLSLS